MERLAGAARLDPRLGRGLAARNGACVSRGRTTPLRGALVLTRFSRLQVLFTILVVGGGLTALAADKLGAESVVNLALMAMVLGVIVFGLDMIVERRADISTPYSDDINPAFHVYRGLSAVAWGVAFVVGGLLLGGYGYITASNWTEAEKFFGERPGIVIALSGILITALGVGQASRATYRYQESEKPVRRLEGRLYAIVFLLPLGLATMFWGLVRTFAPAFADSAASAAKETTLRWLERLLAN